MKDFFANLPDVWEDLELVEKAGVTVLSLLVLALIVACIVWPVLLLIIFIFSAVIGVIVFGIIGISTIIDRI